MPHTIKKMSLIGLILMIFTSVFGFANSPSAYYLMGYSAIPFYIFSALLFFIPFALMMAEMGAAYRKEEGGIYSWMNNSVGPRFAFIGTFMWFSSYIIWMVSTSAKVWVPFSTFLYGSDMTQHWRIAGLEPTQVVGLLAVAWMILVTVVASKGINKIARITAVGGIAVMCLNLVLLLVSITILLLNGGHFAQDINFLASPNPGYQSGLAMLSFVVFAIFAYGGIEAVGGLVDKTENPEKNFAKGIVFAAIVISIGYSLAIFLWGVSTNWQQVLSNGSVNLGNITYVLMKSLGVTLGNALHLSPEASLSLGVWFARITGLSMFLAYTGAFFTLCYSPLKAIIQGTPKALWPEPMTRLNTMGMPSIAMWMQCGLVTVFILLVSFGGGTASAFFNKLTLMANVSMTLPYLFLALAFPFFKARQDLDRPFVIFKTHLSAMIATVVVVLVVTFANVFTIIQPVVEAGDWDSTLWMIGGPVFFSLLAMAIYQNYCSRMANKPELALD
ncbi:glutamate/gamma-aminobutyrate family transporter YjeM [Escherichia coli]|uniref:glutamate/gamma-aminobutyrate family transporter YjeM n=1 Tax=Escherichia coli TaxID=562 RepID=UPI000483402C|nr:glutamate/gamma-aminobutyrate family transporter YjeM [Escherichia coli]EEW9410533.1 glutamate/gamma-aminobutyrate family transporter YjeM [Escherichia coli]EEW9411863.1 glutamate/gamma-aminobutyrate family transporter YjeM [Escherichia coli]EFA9667849.1 glutamate/gamma-aminobutyrate family transporter YjeM [Escherichia coli]EFA9671825.1 glutamate/gamma-aminobutyrate family transporter YjeM [Escherichia coli]EFC8018753.1 glutamate/gamma-aminobutyrate family transporter YjeM [Escherichia col